MNLKDQVTINFNIITEQDLETYLGYRKSEDITDENITSALVCATVRIDELTGGQVVTRFDSFKDETKEKVKRAACFLAQYYLSGGYTWLRGSTSINAGQVSISQSMPDEPDYILQQVYPLLQITDENLFKPTLSFRHNYLNNKYNGEYVDFYPETNITYQQATRMFVKPNKINSNDKSVLVKFTQPIVGEPNVDLSVNVAEVNKYKGDGETVQITDKNVVSSIGLKKLDGDVISADSLLQNLSKKADVTKVKTKIDNDFKNAQIDKLISGDANNALMLSPQDLKLYVSKNNMSGEGTDYFGDNKTVKINENNVISAVGLITNDESDFMTGGELTQVIEKIDNEVNSVLASLKEVKGQIQKNEISLANLSQQATFLDELVTTLKSGFEKTRKQVTLNTNDLDLTKKAFVDLKKIAVFKDKLQDIVSKDKDNSLKVGSDNNLFVPPVSAGENKWKLIQTEKDWIYDNNAKAWKPKTKAPLKATSQYLILYYSTDLMVVFSFLSFGSNVFNSHYLFMEIEDSETFKYLKLNGTSIYGMYCPSKDYCEHIDLSKDTFKIFEIKNAIPEIPTPPSVTISKNDVYSAIKKKFRDYQYDE